MFFNALFCSPHLSLSIVDAVHNLEAVSTLHLHVLHAHVIREDALVLQHLPSEPGDEPLGADLHTLGTAGRKFHQF